MRTRDRIAFAIARLLPDKLRRRWIDIPRCPNCGGVSWCNCSNCREENIAKGRTLYSWDEAGEVEFCGHCGYGMHAEGWLDEEVEQCRALGWWPKPDDSR